ncbi:MAG: hypothetical protein HYX32_06545 [Actinobacteria bacterium]|nr:hypothetical protein [Actinomycetota bacterium]
MMRFPLEKEFIEERAAVVRTIESLSPDEFEHGTTLCDEWAPRDVLAHLVGLDSQLPEYVKTYGNVNRANANIVERFRSLGREDLLGEAKAWAAHPAPMIRPAAWYLLGDLAIHHQDVLRGQGHNRAIPIAIRDAMLREGSMLGFSKLLKYRIEPTDGGRARGRGTTMRGTSEVLALWLAGRKGLDGELEFGS